MAIINDNTLALAVEGYPGRLSYQPGEEVALHCSARTKHFSVEIARVGAEREVVWRRAAIPGTEQPTPPMAYPPDMALRLLYRNAARRRCGWSGCGESRRLCRARPAPWS